MAQEKKNSRVSIFYFVVLDIFCAEYSYWKEREKINEEFLIDLSDYVVTI